MVRGTDENVVLGTPQHMEFSLPPFVSSPHQKQFTKKEKRSLPFHYTQEEVHTEGSGDVDGGDFKGNQ